MIVSFYANGTMITYNPEITVIVTLKMLNTVDISPLKHILTGLITEKYRFIATSPYLLCIDLTLP